MVHVCNMSSLDGKIQSQNNLRCSYIKLLVIKILFTISSRFKDVLWQYISSLRVEQGGESVGGVAVVMKGLLVNSESDSGSESTWIALLIPVKYR